MPSAAWGALIIASEYPFAAIVGVKLNPDVAAVARANARRVARAFSDRAAIEVYVDDASISELLDGNTIIFMYHPFGELLVHRRFASMKMHSSTVTAGL